MQLRHGGPSTANGPARLSLERRAIITDSKALGAISQITWRRHNADNQYRHGGMEHIPRVGGSIFERGFRPGSICFPVEGRGDQQFFPPLPPAFNVGALARELARRFSFLGQTAEAHYARTQACGLCCCPRPVSGTGSHLGGKAGSAPCSVTAQARIRRRDRTPLLQRLEVQKPGTGCLRAAPPKLVSVRS